jgi:hypothetical protein
LVDQVVRFLKAFSRIPPFPHGDQFSYPPPTSPTSSTSPLLFYTSRYRTLGRAVRLGYNVMMLDTDIVLMDDPYKYFKAPPFSSFTILNQAEVDRE